MAERERLYTRPISELPAGTQAYLARLDAQQREAQAAPQPTQPNSEHVLERYVVARLAPALRELRQTIEARGGLEGKVDE